MLLKHMHKISIKNNCFIITSGKTKFKTCWLPWKIPNSLELDPIKFFLSPMDFESLIVTCTYKNYWYTTNIYLLVMCRYIPPSCDAAQILSSLWGHEIVTHSPPTTILPHLNLSRCISGRPNYKTDKTKYTLTVNSSGFINKIMLLIKFK